MATLYKFTTTDDTSYGGMEWGTGVTNEATGDEEQDLCSDGWLHAYESIKLAFLMNPAHGNYGPTYHLWECTGTVGKTKQQTKVGCRELTSDTEIDPSGLIATDSMRLKFAILSARQVYAGATWDAWADAALASIDGLLMPDAAGARAIYTEISQEARNAAQRAVVMLDRVQVDVASAADLSGDTEAEEKAELAKLELKKARDIAAGATPEAAVRSEARVRELAEQAYTLAAATASTPEADRAVEMAGRSKVAADIAVKQAASIAAAAAAVRAGLQEDSLSMEAARAACMAGEAGDVDGQVIDFVAIAEEAYT